MSTAATLGDELVRTVDLDDGDVVLDLSEVRFMDASTIGLIVAAQLLMSAPWTLQLRDPSRIAERVLAMCGMALPTTTLEVTT